MSKLGLGFYSAWLGSRKPPIFRVILSCHQTQHELSLPFCPPKLFLQKTRERSDTVIIFQAAGTRGRGSAALALLPGARHGQVGEQGKSLSHRAPEASVEVS